MISTCRSRQQAAFLVLSAVRHGAVAGILGHRRAALEHGKRARGRGEVPDDVLLGFHDDEPVPAELERLRLAASAVRC